MAWLAASPAPPPGPTRPHLPTHPWPTPPTPSQIKVKAPYHIRVLIPCYSEPLEIVAKTAEAAKSAALPFGCRVTVYLCDDGKDPKKRRWCMQPGRGVVYVSGRTRAPGEMNGKSANLNNCMKQIYPGNCPIPPTEIVCVFDADQVANPDFYLRMVWKFDAGDDVGMVLSPQAFYNLHQHSDIFNHSNIHFWEYAQHGRVQGGRGGGCGWWVLGRCARARACMGGLARPSTTPPHAPTTAPPRPPPPLQL